MKDSGERTGDTVWQLPLDRRLRPELESEVADLKNVGAHRHGGDGARRARPRVAQQGGHGLRHTPAHRLPGGLHAHAGEPSRKRRPLSVREPVRAPPLHPRAVLTLEGGPHALRPAGPVRPAAARRAGGGTCAGGGPCAGREGHGRPGGTRPPGRRAVLRATLGPYVTARARTSRGRAWPGSTACRGPARA
ncbi:hypothetical protein [Corallococcus sp. 4LFB]|uniref:hypothetical protein n=1 Tax=Corallococcus sp. 4LFB TaxID=3383249 RepID=UPI003976ED9E